MSKLSSRAKITTEDAEAISSLSRWTEGLGDIGTQDLVIEAVLEDLGVKRALFAEHEAVIGDGAVLVTNRSSLPIARLSRQSRCPALLRRRLPRLAGTNRLCVDRPAVSQRSRLSHGAVGTRRSDRARRYWHTAAAGTVGFAATDAVAGKAAQRLGRWGVMPYRLADRPGLVIARTLSQIANSAADAVLERVSDEAGIDTAVRCGANFPLGPFAWADQIGRVALAGMLNEIALATGQPIYAPSEYWNR